MYGVAFPHAARQTTELCSHFGDRPQTAPLAICGHERLRRVAAAVYKVDHLPAFFPWRCLRPGWKGTARLALLCCPLCCPAGFSRLCGLQCFGLFWSPFGFTLARPLPLPPTSLSRRRVAAYVAPSVSIRTLPDRSTNPVYLPTIRLPISQTSCLPLTHARQLPQLLSLRPVSPPRSSQRRSSWGAQCQRRATSCPVRGLFAVYRLGSRR
ncbi:hypothetical protein BDY21DRAFT_9209 [Lineolata rhizophorae]|uniref:Uncharacterized protein n=1 Tax=Lineolata rhizophorae TaxID=578093 RepID=A0A6A6PDW8_9PEZI|nr:hypothetical protein BDY21DRAFT_9209 [Lineolata rhizophorae]